ncbi:DUF1707 domain-containing protein [Herbiconiux sp. 11R-BC]|uniref:DUF1707 SHOCT-like domain-containing protein n=1 Tax=Herbiconiux sp. 11R-BC TaxID=3111637 RepID=UPI003C081A37
MTDYSDPATASLRLSDTERATAVSSLARALAEGRITADEFTERSAAAKAAVHRGDLAPLFTDLPDTVHSSGATAGGATPPGAAGAPIPDAAPPAAFAVPPSASSAYGPGVGAPGRDSYSRPRPLGGATGVVIVSVTPIIALLLFLFFGFVFPGGFAWSWIFWLAVPIVGIIIYGPGGRHDYDRR